MATSRTSFLDIAQTLTAYLAIPALLLYPFGFTALFLKFTRYFGLEFYTAWYAASLVNRMVVIGLGTSILLVTLLGGVLLAGNVGQGLLRKDHSGLSTVRRWSMLVARLVIAPLVVLVLYILYSRIVAAGRVYGKAIVGNQSNDCRDEALRHQLNLWPDSLMPALVLTLGAVIVGCIYTAPTGSSFSQRVSIC